MFVSTDFILNGVGHGEIGSQLAMANPHGVNFDPGLMRPFVDDNGKHCVLVNTGRPKVKDGKAVLNSLGQPEAQREKVLVSELIANGLILNSPTSLRKQEWIQFDNIVLTAARKRLRAWADLMAAASYGGFNAMSHMILEHETMNDPGEAVVDLDGLTDSPNFDTKFQLEGLPLPITHAGFTFSSRRLAVSRNMGTPLDSRLAEVAGRRVAEKIEQTLIGTATGLTYGVTADYGRAPTVYGYTTFPDRITKTDFTAPTGGGWTPDDTVNEVLDLLEDLADANYFGPFMLYHSTDWDKYLDRDYSLAGGNNPNQTLRNRLRQIDKIQDVRRLDFLTASTNPFTFVLVQMTADVARAINGMDITTVQWETKGGFQLNFKVLCIQVPQLRADYNGNTGIGHGTTS